jgi:hypothetical protein
MPTYDLIASTTLSSGQSTITFSGIPQTYTDLSLRMSQKSNDTYFMLMRFNGNSGNLYTTLYFGNFGTAFRGGGVENTYEIIGFNQVGQTNMFSNDEIYIPNYSSTTITKETHAHAVTVNNTNSQIYLYNSGNLFNSTTAISSISLFNGGSTNLLTGSSFYLYGIKNS